MPNSKNITFDQLQSALTRVKNSLDKKANTSHGNHVPKTETANNARFLRNDNTWQTITPVNIGAADRSHNHTSLTGVTSLQFAAASSDHATIKVTTDGGSAANTYLDFEMDDDLNTDMFRWRFNAWDVDTSAATGQFNLMTLTAKDTTSARLTVNGDVTASSFTGNATSATKLQSARALKIGNTSKNFDGTGNVTWTLSEIGAAASSHGTHVTYATATPKADGTAAVGTSSKVAREDHVHPIQTTVTGNAGTATKLQTGRSFTIGNTSRTFDGSANVAWSLNDIGAAALSHTHNYVPLSNNSTTKIVADSDASNTDEYAQLQAGHNYLRVTSSGGGGTVTQGADKLTFNGNIVYHAGRKPTASEIGAAASSHTHSSIGGYAVGTYNLVGNNVGMSSTSGNGYAFWAGADGADNSGSAPFRVGHEGSLYAANATLTGTLTGNATTATKLQTARTLTIGNTGKNFDGSGNVSWNLSEIGAASSGHTHSSIRGTIGGSWASATVNTTDGGLFQFAANVVKTATGIFTTSNNANAIISFGKHNGNYASQLGFNNSGDIFYRSADGSALADSTAWKQIAFTSSSITGNAASATKLQNARNIKIGNTTRSFNGTADVSWSLSDIGAAASSHSHSYLPLGGGTVTGNITFSEVTSTTYPANSSKITWNGSTDGADIYYRVTASDKGQLVLNLRDDADATIGIALNGSVKATFDTNGYYSGKANQANTLATARTLTIGNTGKSFNGSGNVSWSLSEIGAAASGHTHNKIQDGGNNTITIDQANDRCGLDGKNNINIATWYGFSISNNCSNNDNYNQVTFSVDARNGQVWARGTINAPTFSGSLSGNASSATKLATARAIKIGNTSRNFDGTGNVTWTLSDIGAAASSHGHNNMLTFKSNHIGDWTDAASMSGKVYMGGWHGNITDTTKDKGYISLALGSSKSLDFYLDGDYYANENNLVLNTGNYKTYVTPANIGAANASHGTHVTYGGNGSATTVSRSDHTHNYIPLGGSSSITGNLEFSNSGTTVRGVIGTIGDNDYWRIVGGATASNSGYLEIATADDANEPIYVRQYGSGKFGTLTRTATLLDASGNTSFPGTVTASSFSGNATSATRLQTARSINGTSFNGTGDITTANWGTSRTITIGNTGKSVNGGGNVNWSIDEIGALKASKQGATDVNTLKTTGRYFIKGTPTNAPTSNHGVIDVAWDIGTPYQIFYPDNVNTAYKRTWNSSNSTWSGWTQLKFTDTNTWRGVQNNLTSDATDQSLSAAQGKVLKGLVDGKAASNHTHGLVNLNSEAFSGGNDLNTYNSTKTWVARTLNSTTNKPADYFTVVNFGANSNSNFQLAHSYANNSTLYVRGRHDTSGNYTPWAKIYTDKNKPTASEIGAAAASHTHNYAGSSSAGGNANAAVKLATARQINGTNFDGSGNITTANWGTGRTITIGNKGKTVNGSGNVSWSLSEIGALPTAGGTVSGNLNVTGTFSIGSKKITINSSAPSSPAVGDIWIKI